MWSNKLIPLSLILGAALAGGATHAAGPDRFMNGQSFYGQPADTQAHARVVDVASVGYVNAAYGETLRFVSAGKTFTWQFNGLDNRGVDLQRIAPPGFVAKPFMVHVGRDPLNRNGG